LCQSPPELFSAAADAAAAVVHHRVSVRLQMRAVGQDMEEDAAFLLQEMILPECR
jgi:hypothetical protein